MTTMTSGQASPPSLQSLSETQAVGQALAPRVLLASRPSPSGDRERDLAHLREVAQWALSYGQSAGFWANQYINNAISGGEQLTIEDSFVYSDGTARKHLVCGESSSFMMQTIKLTIARGEYTSDLIARMAHALGQFAGGQNHALGFHVWVEIVTPADNPLLKIDLWAEGTGAGPLFPSGAPLGLIRDDVSNVTPLVPPVPFTVNSAPSRPVPTPQPGPRPSGY